LEKKFERALCLLEKIEQALSRLTNLLKQLWCFWLLTALWVCWKNNRKHVGSSEKMLKQLWVC
jgi:hypothetical protein